MSNEPIVIRAEEDSILSDLMKFITDKKEHLIRDMGNFLLNDKDRDAAVCAAQVYQLDEIVDVIKESIDNNTKGEDDERPEPIRYTT